MSERHSTPCPHNEFRNGRCVLCGGQQQENLVGQTFNCLTIIAMLPKGRCRCQCSCGNVTETITARVKRGDGGTKSCGHLTKRGGTTHGLSKMPGFRSWQLMKQRCYNQNDEHYPNYGGRGITVCERWCESFPNFLADMGCRPSPRHTIDRFPDNDGNYEPGNCRWATAKEQGRNRRDNTLITLGGQTQPLIVWAETDNIPSRTILWRLNHGWSIENALRTPARRGRNGSGSRVA